MSTRPALYPVGLVVRGRRCLVVGGGRVAARKVAGLLACGAAVTLVAPEAHVAVTELARGGHIEAIEDTPLDIQLRPYRRGEAGGYALVIAATGDPAVDDAAHRDAEEAGVWVNVADDAARCSVVLPALFRDGPVTVTVTTGGASPALAGWLRDHAADALGPGLGELALLLEEGRRRVHERDQSTERVPWRELLDGPLPGLVRQGRTDEARRVLDAFLEQHMS